MRKNIGLLALLAVVLSVLAPVAAQEETQDNRSFVDELQGSVITPAREVEDFTLPATTGEDFTFSEQGGKVLIFYFGYMNCPDVCSAVLANLMRAYKEIGEPAEQVQVVFVTLDPNRDQLEYMDLYLEGFHEDFIGLRPETEEQLEQLKENFGVIANEQAIEGSAHDHDNYLIEHNATTFVVAPDGRLLLQFPEGVEYTEISHDAQVLIDYMVKPAEEAAALAEPAIDPAREFRIVIPEGTGNQIMMGEDPGIIPLKIELVLGQQDIIVLENHDNSDYLVGGIWVAPYETVSKQFFEPQTFEGLCTVTVGRDLIEIIVREPDENGN